VKKCPPKGEGAESIEGRNGKVKKGSLLHPSFDKRVEEKNKSVGSGWGEKGINLFIFLIPREGEDEKKNVAAFV